MTKQELAHIVRLMYDLQEYCRTRDCKDKECRIGGAIIVNDGLVRIPNKVGDYAVKVEYVKN
jgi:hypothetical protein